MPLTAAAAEAALRFYSRVAPSERGGYRLARVARRLRPRQRWRDTFRTPDGLLFQLDLADYPDCSMAFGLYELDTARVLKRLLRPGDHFIDGGANLGYFTLLAAKLVGPTGRVDAFEPQPDNRARLEAHLRLNRLADRVRVHALALSDRPGEAVIHRLGGAGDNHGSATLFPPPGPPGAPGGSAGAVRVPTVRLDEVLAGTHPRLIKLDIEGAEPLAVAGMTGLLARTPPPAIVTELNPTTASRAGFAPAETARRLLDAQPAYRVYKIGWRLQPLASDMDGLARLEQVNLLFQPT